MNYQRIYDQLIDRAVSRKWSKKTAPCYVEEHHIKPASMCQYSKRYGTKELFKFEIDADIPENLVMLTAREHYIAHLLLCKIYGGSMWTSAMLFKEYANSKLYETIKRNASLYVSVRVSAWNKERAANGNHPFTSELQKNRIANGTHNWLGNQQQIELNQKRVENGTHNFLHQNNKGKNNPMWKGFIITPLGKFETLQSAANAHNVTPKTIDNRIKSQSHQFSEYNRIS